VWRALAPNVSGEARYSVASTALFGNFKRIQIQES
jgi:hypothetical protein